jgi:hypothetical protein
METRNGGKSDFGMIFGLELVVLLSNVERYISL